MSASTSNSQESFFRSHGSVSFLDPKALESVESEVEGTGGKSSMRAVSTNGEGRDFPCRPVAETPRARGLWPGFHPRSGD